MTGRQLRSETIADALRRGITDGTYPAGSLLPSIARLAQEHGVSDDPVRRALAVLTAEGMVSPEHGRGVRVTGIPATPATAADDDVVARLTRVEARLAEHVADGHGH